MKTAGIVLIFVGIIALVYGGISYTTREKVPPLLGGLALAGGVALLIVGSKRA